MKSLSQIIQEIDNEFLVNLQKKTSWGKNDVYQLYTSCVSTVLAQAIDDEL